MPGIKERQHMGMVYAMTNAAESNEVIAFRRGNNGTLKRVKAYATGGNGTGTTEVSTATPQDGVDPLASQGSLRLSRDGRYLFAANAGSGSISSFRVANSGALTLADVEPSGGAQPNSLSAYDSLLYVSNVGNAANNYASNVTGFTIAKDGRLTRIKGSTHSLSTANAQPASIIFNPDGSFLVVSELTTNHISVFRVNSDGTITGPIVNTSNGGGPFGSVFLSNGVLLVSEAGPNALSSYSVGTDGKLSVVSGSVLNGQIATCWVVTTRNEHYAYTSNAGSGTISTYHIGNNGMLELVRNVNSTSEGAGAAPIDIGVSKDGQNLYVLIGNKGWISVFRINKNGRLVRIQVVRNQGLPQLGSQGLAVY